MDGRSGVNSQRAKLTRLLVDGEEREFLFQKDIGPFLQAFGYAYSTSEINKLCAPAVNKGPPIALWHGPRPLRTPDAVIAWAEKRLQARMATIFNGR